MGYIPNNKIFMTIDRGRLHLARDETYMGNVNSYNNGFTRFFARLFHKTIEVKFNGGSYCFNKKSYVHLLKKLGVGDVTYKNVSRKYRNLVAIELPRQSFMREHLSSAKVNRLTKKLINALRTSRYAKAEKYAGQGGDINRVYWERGNYGLSFSSSFKKNLPLRPLTLKAEQFTPITRACLDRQTDLVNFMKDLGGIIQTKGQIVHFTRSITDVKTERRTYVTRGTQPIYVQDRNRQVHYAGSVSYPALRHQTIVHTHFLDTAVETEYNQTDIDHSFKRKCLDKPIQHPPHAFVITT